MSDLAAGHVLPLSRRLSRCPDPLRLFAALSDQGRRPHTALLESADVATRLAERSFLVADAALQVVCRGRVVEVTALSAGGHATLPWLAEHLAARAAVAAGEGQVTFTFPPPLAQADEVARLAAPSPTDVLRAVSTGLTVTSAPAAVSQLVVGVFAYDFLGCYEALPEPSQDPLGFPDYVFLVPESLIALDHRRGTTEVLAHVFGGEGCAVRRQDAGLRLERLVAACEAASEERLAPTEVSAELSVGVDQDDAAFAGRVVELKKRIVAGDVFQIVPSRTFSAACPDPLATYGRLRELNPSPYMFFVSGAEHTVFGASPETAVKVTGTPAQVEICPIAGTARRGRRADGSIDLDLDGRLEAQLRLDAKEQAEHMMLIDLARNDVARVSEPGTRHVSKLLTVDRYSHVMHLVSHVTGQLRHGLDALDAYVASMNMGTLVGAPKIEAARILRQVEATKRGPYGGAVGFVTCTGDMDTAIVIRSAVVKDGVAYVRAGAGVVYDSVPESEALETLRKARAVLRALGAAS